jgi:two-component system, NarL family, sensor kinase
VTLSAIGRDAALLLAGLRALAMLALALAAGVSHDPLAVETATSLGAAAIYTLAVLALSVRRRARPLGGWLPYAVLDLAFLALLVHVTGGASSQARLLFLILPLLAALLGGPRDVALAVAASLGAYLGVALSHPETQGMAGHAFVLTEMLLLALGGMVVLALSLLLQVRSMRASEIAESHDRLVSHALETEERERRRLAHELHDDAVQSLLAGSSAIRRVRRGDLESLDIVEEAVTQTATRLRTAIFELLPPELEERGLERSISEMAESKARFAEPSVELEVDPAAAGPHDKLLFSLSRELLGNAIQHARAQRVSLRIERLADRIVLEVEDDGTGIDLRASAAAVRHGHIGLASCTERVQAFAGELSIETPSEGGTRVRVELPARRASDRSELAAALLTQSNTLMYMSDSVGLAEFRRNLSVYLRRVESGERLVITDRNRPVAELGPAPSTGPDLDRSITAGRVSRPVRANIPDSLDLGGDPRVLSRALDEVRGGRLAVTIFYADASALVKLIRDEPGLARCVPSSRRGSGRRRSRRVSYARSPGTATLT